MVKLLFLVQVNRNLRYSQIFRIELKKDQSWHFNPNAKPPPPTVLANIGKHWAYGIKGKRENIKVKEVGKNIKMELDQDFNYVKPQDWIKRRGGLQKRLDSDLLNQNSQSSFYDFWVKMYLFDWLKVQRALVGKFVKMFWSRVRIFSLWSFWDDYIYEFRFLAGSFFV